jgi:hypothetical protein
MRASESYELEKTAIPIPPGESLPGEEAIKDPEADQDSQGDLIVTPDLEDLDSFEDVPVNSIQGTQQLPDFAEPTTSPCPILVRTPQGYYCVDGQNLVTEARGAVQEYIRCHVSNLHDHSEEELALRKAAVREKAPGGVPLYAERVRNVGKLFQLLSQSPDVTRYVHGGDRRGIAFQENNQFENVVAVISHRLAKSRTTVNMLRSFGEYLDDATMERLVHEKVTKDFFEKAQPSKRDLLKILTSEGKSKEEITAAISTKMLEWLEEYKSTKKIERVFPQIQAEPTDNQRTQTPPANPTDFEHWAGAEDQEESNEELTLDDLKEQAKSSCDAFTAILEDPALNMEEFRHEIRVLSRKLMECELKSHSLGEGSSNQEEDA